MKSFVMFLFLFATCWISTRYSFAENATPQPEVVSTFSIVAFDPETREWGIGVASRFLAVGSVVPWAKAEVGAIATQSYANTSYGPEGLKLLQTGRTVDEVIKLLTEADEQRETRQLGIIDGNGRAATYTGEKCHAWAGGKTGMNYACQGNILAGPQVVEEMAKAFEEKTGPLAQRIMSALEAAEAAGGDKRGRQSAALYIVKEKAGYAGFNDRMLDLRVDDHADPIQELKRILKVHLAN